MRTRPLSGILLTLALAGLLSAIEGSNLGAEPGTATRKTVPETKTIQLPGGVEMVFCKISAGSFLMGSPETEQDRDSSEGPIHKVTISTPFYLGQFEVTHAQWAAVMGSIRNYAGFDGSNYDAPMQTTSWNECKDFLEKLNHLGLGRFRLPTEAEWEYACRAGTTSRYYWGDDPELEDIEEYAWFDENAEGEAHRVGEKRPNAWGLFDMAGNVWEWCEDWYASYSPTAQIDPKGPDEGTSKVFRGGEWFSPGQACRSAYRGKFPPDDWLYFGGLRVVMESQP